MKPLLRAGSSGSFTGGVKVASYTTGSGIKKATARTKNTNNIVLATGGQSARKEMKWQEYFESANDPSANNEIVRARLFDVLKDNSWNREAEKSPYSNAGECSGYDVKGLMAEIYQDLQDVAEVQVFKSDFRGTQTQKVCLGELDERVCLGELDERDLFLRDASAGVTTVISKFLQHPSKSILANRSTESALAHLHSPENPQSSEVWNLNEKMARYFSDRDPSYERYGDLYTRHSWKFLTKLAHSTAFRKAACNLDDSTWQAVVASISENAVSLTVFVACNGLRWWNELIHLNSLFPESPSYDFAEYEPVEPKIPTPHKWVVTEKHEDVRRPKFEGRTQINISENIYKQEAFENSVRPPSWPTHRPYPEDPMISHDTSIKPCMTCKSHHPCECSFLDNPHVFSPLVELREYGRKGVGVRALQRIPKGAILAEYLGEIYPWNYSQDPVYALDFSLPGARNDAVIASISSKRYGNWTRFINHSCDSSTKFTMFTVGGRHKAVVEAVKDIDMFEEMTIDYGDGYWKDRVCECGAERCYTRMKMEAKDKEGPESWDLRTVV